TNVTIRINDFVITLRQKTPYSNACRAWSNERKSFNVNVTFFYYQSSSHTIVRILISFKLLREGVWFMCTYRICIKGGLLIEENSIHNKNFARRSNTTIKRTICCAYVGT